MNLPEVFREHCLKNPQRVIFSDGADERILQAARFLKDSSIAEPLILGGAYEIRDLADSLNISTRGLKIINPQNAGSYQPLLNMLLKENQKSQRIRLEQEIKEPLPFAIQKQKINQADIVFSGNLGTMKKVSKAVLKFAGIKPGYKRLSSFYLMFVPVSNRPVAFADCSINVSPTDTQLAEIAIKTAENFEKITGRQARVALLSFSTKGSASHPRAELVKGTLQLIKQLKPNLLVDGELQFDAAIDEKVAQKKAPGGSLKLKKSSPIA